MQCRIGASRNAMKFPNFPILEFCLGSQKIYVYPKALQLNDTSEAKFRMELNRATGQREFPSQWCLFGIGEKVQHCERTNNRNKTKRLLLDDLIHENWPGCSVW
ncbi:hypothetical protein BaRGS_00016930 [Batillaria attramentaria]|uniref:Uncharacterized protein n=1 Tax=Batillaria attramentaria TaxID=370345 RepID=A0ABD0KXW1_9CAEN